MISLEDCIAFCGLDKDEVAAISEHEHIPEIAATALADYLLKQPHGGEAIRTMITDDIHAWRCVISSTKFLKRAPVWRHDAQYANQVTTAISVVI